MYLLNCSGLLSLYILLPASLEQRIQDIKFWKQELEKKFEEMVQEIETLIVFRSRVEKALGSCSQPFQVTLQCLTERYFSL